MASTVRVGSSPSSAATSFSMRPLTPPLSLARSKAASMPSFINRPVSLLGPENGMTMPNLTSLWVTPWTFTGGGRFSVGAVAAIAAGGPSVTRGSVEVRCRGVAIDRSRSASSRSAPVQSIRPLVTALRPSAT